MRHYFDVKMFQEDHMGRDEEQIGGTKLRYKLLFSMHLNPITISCVFGLGIVGILCLRQVSHNPIYFKGNDCVQSGQLSLLNSEVY